jgi:chromate transporter
MTMGSFTWPELMALFTHFLLLSIISVGGAIATAPDMHRYIVTERHWLTDEQFTASVALAQAAPGPNVLFVAVLGYNIAGLAGAAVTMIGIMLPCSALALVATRWGRQRRETRGIRAFTNGMTPLTLGLLVSTGWVLAEPAHHSWRAMLLVALAVVGSLVTKLSPVWLVGIGALIGALGWV